MSMVVSNHGEFLRSYIQGNVIFLSSSKLLKPGTSHKSADIMQARTTFRSIGSVKCKIFIRLI